MYAMLCTRLNVSYNLSMTSHYKANLGEHHWMAVKTILKYLRITKDKFLVYGGGQLKVVGYYDASFQTNKNDNRSHSGFVFILNGIAISWKSPK